MSLEASTYLEDQQEQEQVSPEIVDEIVRAVTEGRYSDALQVLDTLTEEEQHLALGLVSHECDKSSLSENYSAFYNERILRIAEADGHHGPYMTPEM